MIITVININDVNKNLVMEDKNKRFFMRERRKVETEVSQ